MNPVYRQAEDLRRQQRFQECRELLYPLLNVPEEAALANLHIAWSYDNEGVEKLAVPYYTQALAGNLSPADRRHGLLGLASTLRCLGEYAWAMRYFEIAATEFPDAQEFKPFQAMCLYNLGRGKEAVALLLKTLLDTTSSQDILDYRRAIALYADDLDATW